ncbi:LuxR C-terminal-related transcriptional regulator [Actinomadura hibisca]|uniref:LuxR C-terminal-related transcriptional regulator n=1 Tax=Actinomadura hibisca TaxID=68565 RepID=UPI000831ACBF|nr:LuxR family transcriptional regulator [Actinomadura hibisca]
MLVGRGTEQAAIDQVIAGARAGSGHALVLRGAAGIGKSALLEYAAGAASGLRVLRAAGSEAEQGLAFAVLHQLLNPVVDLVDALPGPQRDAVRGALGLAAPPADARFLVAAGVVSLLAEAAGDGGLLCLVDDFQWADRASADALAFAARRVRDDGIALLIAVRGGGAVGGVPDLRIGGLDLESAGRLLEGAAPSVVERLVALTDGNALALREARERLSAAQLAGREALPDPLPVGADLFGDQIAGLEADARWLLLVAAAEGRGDLDAVLDASGTAEALEAVESAGLVRIDGAELRFRHPLIRSAAYTAAEPAERRRAHAALAAVLDDPDRRAWHRAEAALGRDEAVAAELAEAARRAQGRGGYGDAATALRRAADLTPDRPTRARRLLDAARAAWLGGRPGQAQTCLAAARELGGADLRTEAAQLKGRFELNSGDAAEALRIFLEAGPTLELLADAGEAAGVVGDVAAIIEVGERAAHLEDGFLRGMLVGIGALLGGDRERGGAVLREALARPVERAEAADLLWASAAAGYLGEIDMATDFIVRAGRVARVSGMVGQLPVVLEYVATAERLSGRFALSASIAEEGLTLAREAGYANSEAAHLANLAAVAAVRGQQEECERYAADALAIAVPHRVGLRVSVASYALGLLDLGLGRFASAHSRFAALVSAGPGAGHPTTVWRSTPDRVEAAMGCGETAAAHEAVAAYTQWSSTAQTDESRALVARCQALVADGEKALPLYEEALGLHNGSPFEHARTALLYGERLRRVHRAGEARQPLRTAAETFQRLGADPWAKRALEELRAAGETSAAPEADALNSLTPQELRIARLVAEGASNKDVAARLFLSPRTVEYHLYKIYPKLGVASRTELVRHVAGDAQ